MEGQWMRWGAGTSLYSLSDPQHHCWHDRHPDVDWLLSLNSQDIAPAQCPSWFQKHGRPSQMIWSMKNVVETSKVSLLLLVLSWVLRVRSLIRGHSLNISETTFNHKGCLWSLWIGHNQVFKYSYNLQVITVQMLTACGLRRGYNQSVSLLTTWVSPFLD